MAVGGNVYDVSRGSSFYGPGTYFVILVPQPNLTYDMIFI
jgi:predicted heme/steroid binding protein